LNFRLRWNESLNTLHSISWAFNNFNWLWHVAKM
jgi:hypothetical protein